MEFTARTADLQQALGRVISAVDKRSTMPVLSHVLLTVYMRNAVGFLATDLEVFAAAECTAGVPRGGGMICLPSDKLKGALDAALGEEVTVTVQEEGKVLLTSGECRFTLASLPADEFPAMPEPDGVQATFPAGLLPRIIKACGHAVSQNDSKSHLQGIYLCCEEAGTLTAVATDGHRLSLAALDWPAADVCAEGLILSQKTARLLNGIYGGLEFSRPDADNIVHFDAMTTRISSRLIDGQFPEFRRVVPKNHSQALTVDSDALIRALEACGVVSDGKSKAVTLRTDQGMLIVSALGPQGEATVTVPYSGDEDFKVCIPSTQLIQALKSLGGEVFIKFGDDKSPLLLIPVDHQGWDERLEVIMALR